MPKEITIYLSMKESSLANYVEINDCSKRLVTATVSPLPG